MNDKLTTVDNDNNEDLTWVDIENQLKFLYEVVMQCKKPNMQHL